jgi:hypothetical protein
MIVIDDIHVADPAAMLLARFLARSLDRCPVVLVLTRRSDDGTTGIRLLDELEREAAVVPLSSFDQHDTAMFLAAHGVHAEDYGLVPALSRLTEGNPLLLARAVAHTSTSHPLAGVEQVIGDALGALPPEHRDVMALAAVLGMEASQDEIAGLVGGDPEEVAVALDAASAAGLVELGPTGWSFGHELVQRAALAVLTPQETVEAHARALSVVAADDRPAAVTRRAHHALAAAPRSDADAALAIAACRAAARVVARGFDYERSAHLTASAVALAERLATTDELVNVLLEHADALLACGLLADARPVYRRALDQATDPASRARAALGLGGIWVDEHRGQAERERVLSGQRLALEGLPADEDALRIRLIARLAAEAVYDGADVGPVFDAVAAAREFGDAGVLSEVLSLSHHALLAPEHLVERLSLADELIAVASHCGDELRTLFGLLWKTVDLYLAGDGRAERTLLELRERVEAVGCRSIAYVVAAIDVMRLIREGRLDDAEHAADECFRLGLEVGDADATGYYGAHLLAIRWFQGRQLELVETAKEIADSATLVTPEFAFRATTVALVAEAADLSGARARLDELAADGLAALPRSSTWLMGIASIVEASRLLDDADLAAEAYRLLLPFADRPIIPSLAVSCFGSTEWALGVAAATAGHLDTAVEHLEQAVAANVRLGHRPMTMVAHARLADALIRRAHARDRARAVDSLLSAAGIADEIGIPGRAAEWRERAATVDTDSAEADAGELRKDGDRWLVVAGDRRAVAPDLVGVEYLGTLLTHPGTEIPAVELSGVAGLEAGGQEVVDRTTLDAYRRRVAEIDDELAGAGAARDRRRVRRLGEERDALRAELASVLAVDGRSRRFVDSSERARTAVRKAIARAIDAIEASDEAIGSELRATISTGRSCAYLPDPRHPRRWSVCRAS